MGTFSTGYARSQFVGPETSEDPLRMMMADSYRLEKTTAIDALLWRGQIGKAKTTNIFRRARRLVVEARKCSDNIGVLDAFLGEYALSSEEGVILMCLTEVLLRIPDDDTRDRMIRDKLENAGW